MILIVLSTLQSLTPTLASLWVGVSLIFLVASPFRSLDRVWSYLTLASTILFFEAGARIIIPGLWIDHPLHPGRLLLSFGGDWMTYSGIMLVTVPHALHKRWWWYVILAALLVLLGGSRAGLAILLVMIGSWSWKITILFFVAGLIWLIAVRGTDMFSDMSRVQFWARALHQVSWFGHGVWSFRYCSTHYCATHPHNQFLTVLHEQGIIGVVSWLAYWICHVRYFVRDRRMIILIVGHVAYGLTSSFVLLHLWVLCLVLGVYLRRYRGGLWSKRLLLRNGS